MSNTTTDEKALLRSNVQEQEDSRDRQLESHPHYTIVQFTHIKHSPTQTSLDTSIKSKNTLINSERSTTRTSLDTSIKSKGTFTDCGRHSHDWLFSGWNFAHSARKLWRKVTGPE
jgi:hypothetical protein